MESLHVKPQNWSYQLCGHLVAQIWIRVTTRPAKLMQQRSEKDSHDVSELKSRETLLWLQHTVIHEAVDEWRKVCELRAWLYGRNGHFWAFYLIFGLFVRWMDCSCKLYLTLMKSLVAQTSQCVGLGYRQIMMWTLAYCDICILYFI